MLAHSAWKLFSFSFFFFVCFLIFFFLAVLPLFVRSINIPKVRRSRCKRGRRGQVGRKGTQYIREGSRSVRQVGGERVRLSQYYRANRKFESERVYTCGGVSLFLLPSRSSYHDLVRTSLDSAMTRMYFLRITLSVYTAFPSAFFALEWIN